MDSDRDEDRDPLGAWDGCSILLLFLHFFLFTPKFGKRVTGTRKPRDRVVKGLIACDLSQLIQKQEMESAFFK